MRLRTAALATAALFGWLLVGNIPAQDKATPAMPARNPWLADSVYPVTHVNSAATNAVPFAGLLKGKKLTRDRDVKVVPNLWASNPTVKKVGPDTVAFASGTLGIRKLLLTGKACEELAFTPYPGLEGAAKRIDASVVAVLLAKVDAARRAKDDGRLLTAIGGMEALGAPIPNGTSCSDNLFDRDGFHYCVYGGRRVLKTTDDNFAHGPIHIVKSVDVAAALPVQAARGATRIVGLGMTYDGHLAVVAAGALVVLDRDLNLKSFVTFPGEAVENSLAIDERNGIYVATSRRMLKTVWTGEQLSASEADGAWESGYDWTPDDKALAAGATSRGSGTTPVLMGFGNDPDKLVVIADASESGTNLVAFWRDAIPADFKPKYGTKSRRIADQARIEISHYTIEPTPTVLGYGVAVLNGTYPQPAKVPGLANAFTAGVTRPAPKGIQKFVWNPAARRFDKAWVNRAVDNSDLAVPVVSAKTGLLYAAHKETGDYQYVGLDWLTGELKERWVFPDDSRLWNAFGGVTTILDDGDLLIGGAFGIKRAIGEPVR